MGGDGCLEVAGVPESYTFHGCHGVDDAVMACVGVNA